MQRHSLLQAVCEMLEMDPLGAQMAVVVEVTFEKIAGSKFVRARKQRIHFRLRRFDHHADPLVGGGGVFSAGLRASVSPLMAASSAFPGASAPI